LYSFDFFLGIALSFVSKILFSSLFQKKMCSKVLNALLGAEIDFSGSTCLCPNPVLLFAILKDLPDD
jgi:hypothetical protein